jgi:hypothetical protein
MIGAVVHREIFHQDKEAFYALLVFSFLLFLYSVAADGLILSLRQQIDFMEIHGALNRKTDDPNNPNNVVVDKKELETLEMEAVKYHMIAANIHNQGYYPSSVVEKGVATPRTEKQEGSNERAKEISGESYYLEYYADTELTSYQRKALINLLKNDIVFIWFEEDIPKFAINLNDNFHYASADADTMDVRHAEIVNALYNKYGEDGIIAWASIMYRKGREPLKELNTEAFKQTYKYVESTLASMGITGSPKEE